MPEPESVRSKADAMTFQQYREALDALGLTQGGGAQLLGVDARTSRRWATDEREVPPPVARFLRFLIAAKIPAETVMRTLA